MTDWFARAQARIPGGVSSPVRAFGSVGGDPFFVARADGAWLFDTGGRAYLDYVQSWGASILGHAHPRVVEAVQRAAAAGTSYGAPTPGEVELAEAICGRVPSVEDNRAMQDTAPMPVVDSRPMRERPKRPSLSGPQALRVNDARARLVVLDLEKRGPGGVHA